MNAEEMKTRTKNFALSIVRLTDSLPKSRASDVIGRQLLRSATSIGANYRAACRARSKADFISKITIVEEESDEAAYWLELINESHLLHHENLKELHTEAVELTAIFTASGKTAKSHR